MLRGLEGIVPDGRNTNTRLPEPHRSTPVQKCMLHGKP